MYRATKAYHGTRCGDIDRSLQNERMMQGSHTGNRRFSEMKMAPIEGPFFFITRLRALSSVVMMVMVVMMVVVMVMSHAAMMSTAMMAPAHSTMVHSATAAMVHSAAAAVTAATATATVGVRDRRRCQRNRRYRGQQDCKFLHYASSRVQVIREE